MGLDFTRLHTFKSNPDIAVDPDLQITEMVKRLEGEIKENWQVLAPSPGRRVLYFELVESTDKPRMVEGSALDARDPAPPKRTSRIKKRS